MKLFLDDIRNPKDCLSYMGNRIGNKARVYLDNWNVVRDYHEFKEVVEKHHKEIELISFDHDLSSEHYDHSMMVNPKLMNDFYKRDDREMTGYDCALWMREFYEANNISFPKIIVHSMNPVGTLNIASVFR